MWYYFSIGRIEVSRLQGIEVWIFTLMEITHLQFLFSFGFLSSALPRLGVLVIRQELLPLIQDNAFIKLESETATQTSQAP